MLLPGGSFEGKAADACNFRKGAVSDCVGETLTDVFAGACSTADTLNDFADCASAAAGCAACQQLNEVNGTDRNCDKADDGIQNDSCN